MAKFNERGQQVPDKTPLAIPVGFTQPQDLHEIIRSLVKLESERQKEVGGETFEEADDFDTGEDTLVTPYQMHQMQEEAPREAKFLRENKEEELPSNAAAKAKAEAERAEFEQFRKWKAEQAEKKSPSEA